MTKENNKARKLRRKSKDEDNAKKSKPKQQVKFSEAENFIFSEVQNALAESKANHGSIIEANKTIASNTKSILAIDQQMGNYDKTQVAPRFKSLNEKFDLILDIFIDNFEDLELTKDQMKILELEFEDEEELVETDVNAKELTEKGKNGKPMPKAASTKNIPQSSAKKKVTPKVAK